MVTKNITRQGKSCCRIVRRQQPTRTFKNDCSSCWSIRTEADPCMFGICTALKVRGPESHCRTQARTKVNHLWLNHLQVRSWNCSAVEGEALCVPCFCHGTQATSKHIIVSLLPYVLITDLFIFLSNGFIWKLKGMRFLVSFGSGPQQRENVYEYYPFIHFRRLKIFAILNHDKLCREGVVKSPCEKNHFNSTCR